MTIQCCVCHKIKVDRSWKKQPEAEGRVSHSYCPACKKKAMKEITDYKNSLLVAK